MGKSTVGLHVSEALQAQWQAYRKQLRKAQKHFSIENVHQLRVETRRLMAQLILIGTILPDPHVGKARQILKRRLDVLGELRDTHVQIEFLNDRYKRFPGLDRFRDYLKRCEGRLAKPTMKKVHRFNTAKLGRWISRMKRAFHESAHDPAAQRNLGEAVCLATERAFLEVVRRRRAITPDDLTSIHRTRVAFKKFRYMIASLPSDVLQAEPNHLKALAAYQRRLGDIQDVRVMLGRLHDFLRGRKKLSRKLRAFCSYLCNRRVSLVRNYLRHIDELCSFAPSRADFAKYR